MNKKRIFLFGILFLFVIMFLGSAYAVTSYCCEKTTYGAYCQMESNPDKCSSAVKSISVHHTQIAQTYQKAPTLCEATPFCKLGTCVDIKEGLCHERTPKTNCEEEGGTWYEEDADELPQCQLGCCLLGNQAAFVTQNRCKSLSSIYGLETNFRNDIINEFACILSASSDAKGACVIESDYDTTCRLLTRDECQSMGSSGILEPSSEGFFQRLFGNRESSSSSGVESVSFHEGYLCSADELATNCGPRGGTTCVEDKDQVYFLDTCGNLANVYDYSRINDPNYWTYIQEPTCDSVTSKESKECGNCGYYFGSTCKAYRETNAAAPKYGDYICASLDCEDKDFKSLYGRNPKHGEIWCVTTTAKNVDDELKDYLPGTEHYRFKCWEGEVIPEPCDPGRATICNQTNVGGDFKYATCVVNRWQDCMSQETEEECLDESKRDCQWIEGLSVIKDQGTRKVKERFLENEDGKELKASCVPLYPPSGEANSYCASASMQWIITYGYGLAKDKDKLTEDLDWAANTACEDYTDGSDRSNWKKSTSGCFALEGHDDFNKWFEAATSVCRALGDCGADINYIGSEGDNVEYVDYGKIGG